MYERAEGEFINKIFNVTSAEKQFSEWSICCQTIDKQNILESSAQLCIITSGWALTLALLKHCVNGKMTVGRALI